MQPENKSNLSPSREKFIIAIIMCIYPLFGMAVDLLAPSLPAISHDLHVSNMLSKNLIAIFLLGLALGNFFVGFLTDAWGRRKLVIVGFLIFTMASLLPVFFSDIKILLLARLLQGLALGCVGVVVRAILSDILPPEKLIRIATLISTMWGIGPIIGPVIGGYLQYYINWKAGFCFFALYGFICFLSMIIFVPETHFNRQALNFNQIKINFKTIITHRLFVGIVILAGIAYSSLIVFNTLGPFLIQVKLGYTSVYFGHVALWMGVMFLLGARACGRLVKQYQPEAILLVSVPVFLLVSIVGVLLAYLMPKNIWVVIVPSLVMFFGSGIIFPACLGRALALFRHLAGSGSAVMNMITVLITSLTALVMSFITAGSALPMACIYLGLMLLSIMVYGIFISSKKLI